MDIQERYETARNSSNLKSLERTSFSDSDILAASGMAGQKNSDAMLLWQVAFQDKTSAKLKLVEMLSERLMRQMLKHRWTGNPRTVAMECVAWMLHGTCQPCGGLGYKVIPGTPSLSDELCGHCHGTGKVALPETYAHAWLSSYMQILTAVAGGQVMDKLAGDMNLG